ncbi:AAA family ATPase [Kribbella italica]|uniref:Uncharacterized protein n=1 Tax=Kribbella italica TaxID=1540520 RepID=A0A7W9J904_9ACTN|nr:AAA family ATPase [Kribbella italica]MBB5837758.1 hypothetical protein [Kribbella italica]
MAVRRTAPKVDPDRPHIDNQKRKFRINDLAKAELLAEGWKPPRATGTLDEYLEMDYPDLEFTVADLIPEGANVLLNAQYKKGKTTAALNLVRSIADGDDLFGAFRITPVGNVAWWNCEVSERQAVAWLKDMKVRNPENVSLLHLRGQSMPLRNKEVRDWAVKWLKRHSVKVWVVDPFGALYDGEENSNSEIREWLRALDEIKRRAKVNVLVLVAHTGHDAQDDDAVVRARGGARLMDWPDVIWTYRGGSDIDPSLRFMTAMGRDVEVPEFTLSFEPSTRTLTRVNGVGSRADQRRVSLAYQVATLVREQFDATGKPINKSGIEKEIHKKATEVQRAVSYAVDMNWIRVEDGPNRSKLHYPGEDEPELTASGWNPVVVGSEKE